MKAVMLAAGIGARLGSSITEPPPKVLLRFGGKSLLEYHLEILRQQGIDELVLGVGYKYQEIEREIMALGAQDFVRVVFNEDYREGNIVTLWTVRDELRCDGPVLLMDADILYDQELLQRLMNSPHRNCLLLDRDFEPGDEPVKICVRDGEIVEFRKWLSTGFDFCGESVGMFKLSSDAAQLIIAQTALYLDQGRRHEPYEETIRDVLLTSPRGAFAFEDITGLPWIEIDFAADVARAETEILPRIALNAGRRHDAPAATKSRDTTVSTKDINKGAAQDL
ncbi:MAG: phosphocholine cytidylyltransferase family protein [Rhodospirillaceae bacterium]|jgi:choline kinase|nr:phosphocholine cytidylyltransferase family protein [Rhodospirillaceae bacterium]MBT5195208.1 phosphocholine cytidylyltransferase family protein [Rhodospirillaceae bacterium]MBT5897761.1 phosphocholine cytidylyltransferase family protein [Rhodospirillaceae bacterium]MBT6427825.1 phosphocholine cytidylyltransferase family protein [Rhodospirillaceae bacterium]MBT7757595.1 phosphocholine cytidylyltransferase family protein [Rhodospirillaceae bacterium]